MLSHSGVSHSFGDVYRDCIRRYTDLLQVVETLELSLASITVICRMLVVFVLLQSILVAENALADLASEPMFALLMAETEFPIMGRPTSVAPATFDLIGVIGAVVEMVANAV